MNTEPRYRDLGAGITRVDCLLQGQADLAACYLVVDGGEAAFIDTGTAHTAPLLLELLREKNLPPAAVRYVIPTHVHLDHAGGAGAVMAHLPRAELIAHPRGLRHLVDPARLQAGAEAVYGEAGFRRLFGELAPVPADRAFEAGDGTVLTLGARVLEIIDSPGHAYHHFCVYDERSRGIFTGDTFGLSYRPFDTDRGPLVLPTTTPVHFDPGAWLQTLDRLLARKPERVYLTHFGEIAPAGGAADQLRRGLHEYVNIAESVADAENRLELLKEKLFGHALRAAAGHGCKLSEHEVRDLLAMDMELNAQGLSVWLDKKRRQ